MAVAVVAVEDGVAEAAGMAGGGDVGAAVGAGVEAGAEGEGKDCLGYGTVGIVTLIPLSGLTWAWCYEALRLTLTAWRPECLSPPNPLVTLGVQWA